MRAKQQIRSNVGVSTKHQFSQINLFSTYQIQYLCFKQTFVMFTLIFQNEMHR